MNSAYIWFVVLLNNLLTVKLDLPNCSANPSPIFRSSVSTTFIRLKFDMLSKTFKIRCKYIDF